MEVTTVLQIVFIFVIFIINLIFVLLPLKIIPRDPSKLSGSKSTRIISFCNCFSGGVFLGVCFLQLTPYINAKLQSVFRRTGANPKFCLPVTQCIIILGFFLTLFIEQIVKKIQRARKKVHLENTESESIQLPHLVQHTWLPSSSDLDTGSTGSEDSDNDHSTNTQEKKRMLRHKHRKKSNKKSNTSNSALVASKKQPRLSNSAPVSFSSEDHSLTLERTNAVSHHGHSHMGDMVGDDFGFGCVLLLLALSLHSFFEGIAIGLQDEVSKLVNLFVGVVVHECLVAFAIGINLAQQKLKLSTLIKLSLFFSSTIPVGIALGLVIGAAHDSLAGQITSAIIQAVAAGTFYHVIFLEMLPAEINAVGDGLWKVLFLFLGFGVITALSFSMSDHH